MLQLTDTVTSLAHDVSDTVTALAHEVASKAQDAAQVAGERGKEWGQVVEKRGKQAVKSGKETLASVGVLPKPSHKGRNLAVLVVLALLGFVAWKAVSGKKEKSRTSGGGSFPEAERHADNNSVRVA